MNDVYAENHQNDPDNKPTADAAKLLPLAKAIGTRIRQRDRDGSRYGFTASCVTFGELRSLLVGLLAGDRFEVLNDGKDRWVLVDHESDEDAGVFPTKEAAQDALIEAAEIETANTRAQPAPTACKHCGRYFEHEAHCPYQGAQPATPAGEPVKENAEEITRYVAACVRRGIVLPNADAWADALLRVADGLAARPKVEDADLLNAVTDLVDEEVFGDAANRDKAERIIDLILTAKLASPDRETIRRMIGDLRYHGSALCSHTADLLERLAGEKAGFKRATQGALAALETQTNRTKAAESKLAEREAELAKAADDLELACGLIQGADNPQMTDEWQSRKHAFYERHAARQKQKASAEPTAREVK